MFGIGHLLRKVQSRQGKVDFISGIICGAMKDVTKFDIRHENIKIQGQNIYINGVSQTLKSEIFIKKSLVLKIINTKQESVVFLDIK